MWFKYGSFYISIQDLIYLIVGSTLMSVVVICMLIGFIGEKITKWRSK
jgi:hypothetical protein